MKIILIAFLFGLSFASFASCPMENGDVIFVKSQTNQAKLLKVVTQSDWTHVGTLFKNSDRWEVIEAVQPVKWTPLKSFIERSKNFDYEIYRPNFYFSATQLRNYLEKYLNQDYDLIFSWDSNRWYCSELVWKAFKQIADKELGKLELIGNLNVTNPDILVEAQKRHENYGLRFNLDEWLASQIITPIEMKSSVNLSFKFSKENLAELEECK